MMRNKPQILVLLGVFIICGLSSFVDNTEFTKSDTNKNLLDKTASSSESDDDSKEKRSEENIMFGNQQNKASAFADDIMSMDDSSSDAIKDDSSLDAIKDDSDHKNDTHLEDTDKEDTELEDVLKDDSSASNEKGTTSENLKSGKYYLDMDQNPADWYGSYSSYDNTPAFTDVLGYIGSPHQAMNDDDIANIIEREDARKRSQPWMMTLRKRRSLRSPLGQMIQTRGRRLPRRSMRFKRQVDVQDILSLLNNIDPNTVGKNYDQTPNMYINYRYSEPSPTSSFRHPYEFIKQDKNRVHEEDEENLPNYMEGFNNNRDGEEIAGYSQPPAVPLNARYFEPEEYSMSNIRPVMEEEKNQDIEQDWVEPEPAMFSTRRPASVFSVSRRSTPLFYPIDYRFIPGPGFKKKSFSGRHHNDDQETEFGKWGKVVNIPEAYASAEDVARLYDLANLLAENSSPGIRKRRSV